MIARAIDRTSNKQNDGAAERVIDKETDRVPEPQIEQQIKRWIE